MPSHAAPDGARIYLDNAATSWPKPAAVYDAVDQYQRQVGAPAGRGVYAQAESVNRSLEQARLQLARLIDAPSSDNVLWSYSGTDATNLALRGLLQAGDHVITTVCDHNAVLRPLRYLEQQGIIAVSRVGCDAVGRISADDVRAALRPNTRLIAMVHASNVTGTVQPVEAVAAARRAHGALLLVDAAQTVGHRPLSVQELDCDLLAAPGHKGLLAPTGTGFLYARDAVRECLVPLRFGGTGTESDSDEPPRHGVAAFEAGNANVPGLIGLAAGLAYLQDRTPDVLARHEASLVAQLLDQLATLSHVRIVGCRAPDTARVGVVSMQVDGFAPQELAVVLDQAAGIQVRAGFHCAPRQHEALHTAAAGGTVRVSFGPFNSPGDVQCLVDVLADLR